MLDIIFICRRAPDWAGLSADYREGRPINERRFVPQHHIPGFPKDVDRLVREWNKLMAIDFFTFRAKAAEISRESIAAVRSSISLVAGDPNLTQVVGDNPGALIYFHDDDDFFAPHMADLLAQMVQGSDAEILITPLIRIGNPTFTFATRDMEPDLVWGDRRSFDWAVQSNNYGLRLGKVITTETFMDFSDHVEASGAIERAGISSIHRSDVLSATIKTPASASLLESLFGRRTRVKNVFNRKAPITKYAREYVDKTDSTSVPEQYAWMTEKSDRVRQMVHEAAGL